jgi:hypothetical protein
MARKALILIMFALTAGSVGCAQALYVLLQGGAHGEGPAAGLSSSSRDAELFQKRTSLTLKFNNNPDTDAWHEHRQHIAQAVGDRVFDKDFARTFDSLVLAVSTMELKVSNMERQSGYIAASGISLSPTESKAMRREAVNEWCRQNGFDPSILDQPFRTSAYQNMSTMADLSEMMAKYDKMQRGLTFQLVKMGKSQVKVKLRFSDVYYPREVETYYKLVWQAVDKQIFIDQNVEDAVEKRE